MVLSVAEALCSLSAISKTPAYMFVSIQELEAAINYWRNQSPASGEALQLCAEASALAKPYAMMIVQGSARIPLDVLDETARSALKVFLAR